MAGKARKGLPKRALTGKNKWVQDENYKTKVRQRKLTNVLQSSGPEFAANYVKSGHASKGDVELIAASGNSISEKAMKVLELLK